MGEPPVMLQQRAVQSIGAASVAAFFQTEIRAWRGEEPLYKVFWGYGVIVSGVTVIFYGAALYAQRVGLQQALLICFAGYTVWILVSVWRCAKNAREPYWGTLARQLTVVWAGNAAMLGFFLEADVIERLFGG
jgi:hypothetical protein